MTLQEFTRAVAWPMGEETELEMWATVLGTLPVCMAIGGVVMLLAWCIAPVPVFVEEWVDTWQGAVWAELCNGGAQGTQGAHCATYQWLPPVAAIVLMLPVGIVRLDPLRGG